MQFLFLETILTFSEPFRDPTAVSNLENKQRLIKVSVSVKYRMCIIEFIMCTSLTMQK